MRDVSLSVKAGGCVGLLGLNGAGKSTLLSCIAGLLPAEAGSVRLEDQDLTRQPSWTRCARGLVLVPAGRQLFTSLSVLDNLLVGGHSVRSRSARDALLEQAYEFFPVLREKRHQRAGELSGGQQQMVAIARGLAANPKILAVDEPCLGLAEAVAKRVYDALAKIHEQGTTLIVVEEAPRRALTLCNRRVEVRNGVAGDSVAGAA